MKQTNNWWEGFFHGIALDFWRAAISGQQPRSEVDFIRRTTFEPDSETAAYL